MDELAAARAYDRAAIAYWPENPTLNVRTAMHFDLLTMTPKYMKQHRHAERLTLMSHLKHIPVSQHAFLLPNIEDAADDAEDLALVPYTVTTLHAAATAVEAALNPCCAVSHPGLRERGR